MGLSLRGSTSGAIDINPPAVAGDNAITLPASNGSANQFFKNSGTAGIVTYSSMVEKSDNIGIGTNNPTDHLQILHTNGKGLTFKTTENHYAQITADSNRTGSDNHLLAIEGHWNGTPVAEIAFKTGDDTTNKDNGEIIFRTAPASNLSSNERLRITSAGKVGIGTDNPSMKLSIYGTGSVRSEIVCTNYNDAGAGIYLRTMNGGSTVSNATLNTNTTGDLLIWTGTSGASERLRVLSGGGLTFNGDTATANALDDYEEGTITTWRLVKSDANTNGSNNAETEVQYTKIGRCVYISGHIRTDSTETGKTGNLKLVSTADGSTAATLPFVPNHRGGLPIVHTRSCSTSDTTYGLSVGFNQGSSTVYVYANDSTGDYILDSNTLDCNTQTNLVITFNGHYFTDS